MWILGWLAAALVSGPPAFTLSARADGLASWTVGALPTGANFNAVAFGGGQFASVASGGALVTSADGVTWQPRSSGTTRDLNGIAYGNGQFVAVGASGVITTSADGISWATQTSGLTESLNGVAFGNGQFVAVGAQNTILISADGAHWTAESAAAFTLLDSLFGVTYGNGQFVAVGLAYDNQSQSYGSIYTSTDGVTWTEQLSGSSRPFFGVAYGNGAFAAVGGASRLLGGPNAVVVTSADGAHWTIRSSDSNPIFQTILNGAAFGGGAFAAVGNDGALLTSMDGSNWTARASGVSVNLRGAAFGKNVFAVVGEGGVVLGSGPLLTSPVILTQPLGQTTEAGTTVTLSAQAGGSPPLFYQWQFNGTALAGATNATLSLTNIQTAQAGSYVLLVSNAAGTAASAPAVLTVNPASALSFDLSPTIFTNDYTGVVTLRITGLQPGQAIRLDNFDDIIGSGAIDPQDPLVGSYWVKDGAVSIIGGATNLNVVADEDGQTNGEITVHLDLTSDFGMDRITGHYLVEVSDPSGVFAPVVRGFQIAPKPLAQGVVGTLFDSASSQPVAGGVAALLDLDKGTVVGSAFTDANGRYTIYCPPGSYLLLPLRVGYYAGFSASDFGQLLQMLVLVSPNKMTFHDASVTPGDRVISGRLDDAATGAGLSGVMIYALSLSQTARSLQFAFAFSDPQGNFKLPVTAGAWSISLPPIALSRLGYVAMTNLPPINVSTGDVQNVTLPAPAANAMIYGQIEDSAGRPLPGLSLQADAIVVAQGQTNEYRTAGRSDDQGRYSVAAAPGAWSIRFTDASIAALRSMGLESASLLIQLDSGQSIRTNIVLAAIPNPDPGVFAWHWSNPLPQGNALEDVTYGNGTYVAVGSGGAILRSTDGSHWTIVHAGQTADFINVLYGAGRFVAIGQNYQGLGPGSGSFLGTYAADFLVSSNAVDWMPASPSFQSSQPLTSAAFGNQTFVVTADDGAVLASSDGLQWQSSTIGEVSATNYVSNVAFGNGIFVAINAHGTSFTSNDGLHWSAHAASANFRAVAFANFTGGGLFVSLADQAGAGNATAILTSPDGAAWTASPNSLGGSFFTLAAGDGKLLAFGESALSPIMVSSDGSSWSGANISVSDEIANNLPAAVWADNRWVGVGRDGLIINSDDGTNWVEVSGGARDSLESVAAGRGLAIAAGQMGQELLSVENGAWNEAQPIGGNLSGGFSRIVYGNGLFLAVGNSGAIQVSSDGLNWSPAVRKTYGAISDLAYGRGLWLAASDGGILYSSDGFHWQFANSTTNSSFQAVAAGGNSFLALSSFRGSSVAAWWTSSNGVDWAEQTSAGDSVSVRALTYGDGLFVAAGDGGLIVTSPSGADWTAADSGAEANLMGVAFGHGTFVAAGADGTLLVSGDGLNWTPEFSGATALADVVYDQSRRTFLAVGDYGAILESDPIADISPLIASEPDSYTAPLGASVTFRAIAQSTLRHSLQWEKNGVPIAGATNAELYLGNISLTDAGSYTLAASNTAGVTLSAPGMLEVAANPPDPLDVWIPQASGVSNDLYSVAYGDSAGAFVAAGDSGQLLQSVTGYLGQSLWSSDFSGVRSPLYSLATSGSFVAAAAVAVGDQGTILSTRFLSTQFGASWSQADSPTTNALYGATYGGGDYAAVGANGALLVSSDGAKWRAVASGTESDLAAVTYGDGRFLAVGCDGVILTSTNAIEWAGETLNLTNCLLSCAYGNGRFVAVGQSGLIIASTDMLHWQLASSGVAGDLSSVAFGDGEFLAVGDHGAVVTSLDGYVWSARPSGATQNLYGAAYGNGRFLVVGAGGVMLQSAPVVRLELTSASNDALKLRGPGGETYRIEAADALRNGAVWRWVETFYAPTLPAPAPLPPMTIPGSYSSEFFRAVLLR